MQGIFISVTKREPYERSSKEIGSIKENLRSMEKSQKEPGCVVWFLANGLVSDHQTSPYKRI